MRRINRTLQGILLLTLILLPLRSALSASAREIDRNATAALQTLYKTTPGAKTLANNAKGILVFPNIVKAGFIIGGQYGDGALREKGKKGVYAFIFSQKGLMAGIGLQGSKITRIRPDE